MSRRRQFWFLVTLFLVPPIAARTQDEADKKQLAGDAKAAGTTEPVKKPATMDPNYIIGAQDTVDISVWKEPELSRNVPVRPDGKISLPLLNDVQAAGLTPTQLGNQIAAGLKKYVADPQVTVIVTTMKSQRYYILGEAGRAGAFELLPNMTVLEALSSGGGFSPFAKVKKIYVLRMVDGKQEKYPFNYKDVIAGKHIEQNIVLKPGDTIIIP